MKYYLLGVFAFFVILDVSAGPAANALPQNVNIIGDSAPQTAMRHVEAAIDRAQQITTAMETLLTLNQSLQYQIQAAQALSEGSWDGFVEYFSYQTAAIAGYSSSIANLNEVTAIFAKDDVFTGSNYESLKTRANNMSRSMNAANEMVRSTDNLIKQSEYNAMLLQNGIRDAANAPNPLQALQGQAKILSAIAGESRASTQLLYTQQRYLQTLIQSNEELARIDKQLDRNFMKAPDEHDPDNPYRRPPESDKIKESLDGRFINGSDRLQW
jgi:hypothetical protein